MNRNNNDYDLVERNPVLDNNMGKAAPPETYPALGKTESKKLIGWHDLSILLASWLLLFLAIITVLPNKSATAFIPWKLGVTKQFQVIGVLMSLMNALFFAIAQKSFYCVESLLGSSCIQNYDAILRNSFIQPSTTFKWRFMLLVCFILPIALSVSYKEFDHGLGRHTLGETKPGNYGLTAPSYIDSIGLIGLSIMANATLPFMNATLNDPSLPEYPTPYGYNTLLLSNKSSAKLDGPIPDYVSDIQRSLKTNEAYTLNASVFATVTTYNNSIETNRDNDDFWNYYLGMMGGIGDLSAGNETALHSAIVSSNLYNGKTMAVLLNNLMDHGQVLNTSWMFAAFIDTQSSSPNADIAAVDDFRSTALLFHTRRESCSGQWRITYNSIQLIGGACGQPPLPDTDQVLFTNSTLSLVDWYLPSLIEYLGPFSMARSNSPWLLPTVSTVIAGMYWSRVTNLNGYQGIGSDNNSTGDAPPGPTPLAIKAYYPVNDTVISERTVMNAPAALYVVLALPAVLTTLMFIFCCILARVPLDSGFGMIALLAGVQPQTLQLLKGASLSGTLTERVSVKIPGFDAPGPMHGVGGPHQEYRLMPTADLPPGGKMWDTLRRLWSRG